MDAVARLQELYAAKGKHAAYQALHPDVAHAAGCDFTQGISKQEAERWRFISDAVSFAGKSVLDVGANTGYFSFASLAAGAANVVAYEGNAAHAAFLETAGECLGYGANRFAVRNKYFDVLQNNNSEHFDVMLFLNVLHHLGDDYGQQELNRKQFFTAAARTLQKLAARTEIMVFQMGYNWQGDRNKPLFPGGTKRELIRFVTEASAGFWRVAAIGIARRAGGEILYEELSGKNTERDDSLGEFLNRPLFILMQPD